MCVLSLELYVEAPFFFVRWVWLPNGWRRVTSFAVAGILLSAAVSSLFYFVVYPQTTITIVTEDIVHQGDLVISGDQIFIVEDATYINDGNIIIKDQAKLILRNATLMLNMTDLRTWYGGEPPSSLEEARRLGDPPVYSVNVQDTASFEAFDATIKSPSVRHFVVHISDRASVALSGTRIEEVIWFTGNSSGVIRDSIVMRLNPIGNSNVSIINSTFPSQIFSLYQNAHVSIINSTSTRTGPIDAYSYFGELYFEDTNLLIVMSISSSNFRISGSIAFLERAYTYPSGSTVQYPRISHWEASNVTRGYEVIALYPDETPAPNTDLKLYDHSGALVWSGSSDENGRAEFEIKYTDENFSSKFDLRANNNGLTQQTFIEFFSSTPVYLRLHQ